MKINKLKKINLAQFYIQLITSILFAYLSVRDKDDIYSRINTITELEAEEIIKKINENKVETDPQKQWLKMLKDGVFDND